MWLDLIEHVFFSNLVLHHSAQIFEVPLTLVALVGTVWNVISGSRTSVFKLGLGRQHVSGLLKHYVELESKQTILCPDH